MASQVNSSDPAMIENVGKSLLHGIGNILSASSAGAKFDKNKIKHDDNKGNATKNKVRSYFIMMLHTVN